MSRRKWGPGWAPLHEAEEGGEPRPEPKGIECPHCGCRHFFTVKSRPSTKGYVLRRKECRHCGHRLTTKERVIGGDGE